MPNNLPRLEKAIKRIIWEQKHKAPNESQNYVQWLQKIDVFFTGLTAIASVGSLLGIAFYYGLNNSTNEASGFLVGLHAALFLFTVNILLGICFAFNRFVLHAGILKWIVNLLILISAAAYFFPAASNWFRYISSKEFLFFSLASYSLVFLSAKALDLANSYRMNPSLILASSFIVVIFIGTFLLMLPKSTKEPIDLIDAFFHIYQCCLCHRSVADRHLANIYEFRPSRSLGPNSDWRLRINRFYQRFCYFLCWLYLCLQPAAHPRHDLLQIHGCPFAYSPLYSRLYTKY